MCYINKLCLDLTLFSATLFTPCQLNSSLDHCNSPALHSKPRDCWITFSDNFYLISRFHRGRLARKARTNAASDSISKCLMLKLDDMGGFWLKGCLTFSNKLCESFWFDCEKKHWRKRKCKNINYLYSLSATIFGEGCEIRRRALLCHCFCVKLWPESWCLSPAEEGGNERRVKWKKKKIQSTRRYGRSSSSRINCSLQPAYFKFFNQVSDDNLFSWGCVETLHQHVYMVYWATYIISVVFLLFRTVLRNSNVLKEKFNFWALSML